MATKTWQVNTLERELADNYVYLKLKPLVQRVKYL